MLLADMMRFGTESADKVLDDRLWRSHPMMMWWGGSNQSVFWLFLALWLITWILIIVTLIVLIRWLWKKGDKVR